MASLLVLQIRTRMDQGVMTMNEYFTFFKAPGLEPHKRMQFIVTLRTPVGWVSLLYRSAVGVFYSPSLGNRVRMNLMKSI